MKRKKFVKKCMSIGIHHNAANCMARYKDGKMAVLLGRAATGQQITNCTETKDGVLFKVKARNAGGGGHE